MLIYGASNTNIRREAEDDTFNLIEIIEEPSVGIIVDKPLEQPAKAQVVGEVDHQKVEPAGQGDDAHTQVLAGQDGWLSRRLYLENYILRFYP